MTHKNQKLASVSILLVLFMIAASLSAQARPVTEILVGGLVSVNNFFEAREYQPYSKTIDFFFFAVLFIAIYMMGAKYAFKEMKRPEQVIVILLGLMTAFLLVLADISATILLPYIHWLIYAMLFVLFWILLKGIQNKFWRFVLALLLTLLTILIFQGLFSFIDGNDLSGGSIGGGIFGGGVGGNIGSSGSSGITLPTVFGDFFKSFGGISLPDISTPGIPSYMDNLFGTGTQTDGSSTTITGPITTTNGSGAANKDEGSSGWWLLLFLLPLLLLLLYALKKRRDRGAPPGPAPTPAPADDEIQKILQKIDEIIRKKKESITKIRDSYLERVELVKAADKRQVLLNQLATDLANLFTDEGRQKIEAQHDDFYKFVKQELILTDSLKSLKEVERELLGLLDAWKALVLQKTQRDITPYIESLKKVIADKGSFNPQGLKKSDWPLHLIGIIWLIQIYYDYEKFEETLAKDLGALESNENIEELVKGKYQLISDRQLRLKYYMILEHRLLEELFKKVLMQIQLLEALKKFIEDGTLPYKGGGHSKYNPHFDPTKIVFDPEYDDPTQPDEEEYDPPEKPIVDVDLSPWFHLAKNQNSFGACTAFATCSMYEYLNARFISMLPPNSNEKIIEVSELFNWYYSRFNKNRRNSGSHMSISSRNIKTLGVSLDNWWPWEEREDIWNKKPEILRQGMEDPNIDAKNQTIFKVYTLPYSKTDKVMVKTKIIYALLNDYPLNFAIAPRRNFHYATGKEYIADSEGTNPSTDAYGNHGLHALVIVGYAVNYKTKDGKEVGEAFKIRNSWGSEWGVDGHIWMNADYLVELVTELNCPPRLFRGAGFLGTFNGKKSGYPIKIKILIPNKQPTPVLHLGDFVKGLKAVAYGQAGLLDINQEIGFRFYWFVEQGKISKGIHIGPETEKSDYPVNTMFMEGKARLKVMLYDENKKKLGLDEIEVVLKKGGVWFEDEEKPTKEGLTRKLIAQGKAPFGLLGEGEGAGKEVLLIELTIDGRKLITSGTGERMPEDYEKLDFKKDFNGAFVMINSPRHDPEGQNPYTIDEQIDFSVSVRNIKMPKDGFVYGWFEITKDHSKNMQLSKDNTKLLINGQSRSEELNDKLIAKELGEGNHWLILVLFDVFGPRKGIITNPICVVVGKKRLNGKKELYQLTEGDVEVLTEKSTSLSIIYPNAKNFSAKNPFYLNDTIMFTANVNLNVPKEGYKYSWMDVEDELKVFAHGTVFNSYADNERFDIPTDKYLGNYPDRTINSFVPAAILGPGKHTIIAVLLDVYPEREGFKRHIFAKSIPIYIGNELRKGRLMLPIPKVFEKGFEIVTINNVEGVLATVTSPKNDEQGINPLTIRKDIVCSANILNIKIPKEGFPYVWIKIAGDEVNEGNIAGHVKEILMHGVAHKNEITDKIPFDKFDWGMNKVSILFSNVFPDNIIKRTFLLASPVTVFIKEVTPKGLLKAAESVIVEEVQAGGQKLLTSGTGGPANQKLLTDSTGSPSKIDSPRFSGPVLIISSPRNDPEGRYPYSLNDEIEFNCSVRNIPKSNDGSLQYAWVEVRPEWIEKRAVENIISPLAVGNIYESEVKDRIGADLIGAGQHVIVFVIVNLFGPKMDFISSPVVLTVVQRSLNNREIETLTNLQQNGQIKAPRQLQLTGVIEEAKQEGKNFEKTEQKIEEMDGQLLKLEVMARRSIKAEKMAEYKKYLLRALDYIIEEKNEMSGHIRRLKKKMRDQKRLEDLLKSLDRNIKDAKEKLNFKYILFAKSDLHELMSLQVRGRKPIPYNRAREKSDYLREQSQRLPNSRNFRLEDITPENQLNEFNEEHGTQKGETDPRWASLSPLRKRLTEEAAVREDLGRIMARANQLSNTPQSSERRNWLRDEDF